ncbi:MULTISPECIES: hypothetical protein [unclassified Corallococcus]|uniref:hypothetical protein n=1 Tax=unclassified Corallococcus TaxID=2685029 RepID=UPI001A8CC011|nr:MULTISPECIES: hypothetical protein [unclassified Corallococcus]MBN9685387.1 hypothetical protein [Corallococcus sp. NCSPR001]WAS83162.1 hypothetical protein O0N60_28055 [Corallococcus sp. NCRR]
MAEELERNADDAGASSAAADAELPSNGGLADELPEEEQRLPPRNPDLFARKAAPAPSEYTPAREEAVPEVLPPDEAQPARRASPTGKKMGRPVGDDPRRRERTYREKVAKCRTPEDFREANIWALTYGVAIKPMARDAELAKFGTVGGQKFVERARGAGAGQAKPAVSPPPPGGGAPGAAGPVSPGPAAPAAASPGAQAAGAAAPGAPPEPPPPPEPPKYMGQDFQRVRKFAEAALPFAALLGEVSKRVGVDVSQPTKRRLFAGTPYEGQYEGDPVARMAELAGVIMAKRAPTDAEGGMPAEVELAGVAGLVLLPAAPIIASKAGDFLTDLAVRVTGIAQKLSGFIRSRRR